VNDFESKNLYVIIIIIIKCIYKVHFRGCHKCAKNSSYTLNNNVFSLFLNVVRVIADDLSSSGRLLLQQLQYSIMLQHPKIAQRDDSVTSEQCIGSKLVQNSVSFVSDDCNSVSQASNQWYFAQWSKKDFRRRRSSAVVVCSCGLT